MRNDALLGEPDMDTREKTLPRGPQETAGPDPSVNPDAIVDNPGIDDATGSISGLDYDSPRTLAFKDDEPAGDVGPEVGKKPLLTREQWQIVGVIAGGVAVAGIAGILYARSRRPESRIERFAHRIGLNKFNLSKPAYGYGKQVKQARDRLHHYEGKAREQMAHLEELARDRLSRMERPHLSDFHFSDIHFGRSPQKKASDRLMAFFK
jgi:hypothetical protein